jgi:uncharacterized membrane-anchored protein YhcB (DUF1043 family)
MNDQEMAMVAEESERKFRMYGILLAILFVIGVSEGLYAWWLTQHVREMERTVKSQITTHQESLQDLAARFDQSEQGFANLRSDYATTKTHLGTTQSDLQKARMMATQMAEQQKKASEQFTSQLGELKQDQEATRGSVGSITTDMGGVKQDLSATKEALASTRTELQRVVGDLGVQSDLIAKNHDELSELRLRSDRDYFEFDLRKAKQPQKVGDVALFLKSTDIKRQKFSLNLVADDRTIEKKDRTINEPVQFYLSGNKLPTEIVVNEVYKDRVVGYISSPKKKDSRVSALASPSANGS